jgi:hypothetical protein
MAEWQFLLDRARIGRRLLLLAPLLALGVGLALAQRGDDPAPVDVAFARGVVFHDRNGNGVRDDGEPGIPGVRVSNQREVVVTDEQGHWTLPVHGDCTFFVVKPAGWMTPVNEQQLPRFFYHHRPEGSPELLYGGMEPTGDLPDSIDFPLVPHDEPEKFDVIVFADPQPYNLQQVDYVAHDVVAELIGSDAAFGVTLGDIVGDDLNLFEPLNAAISKIGVPWYNVIGNHDIDRDAENNQHSAETFRRVYGPDYYSFEYSHVHFIALNNIFWNGRRYTGHLTVEQLQWIANDLEHVPDDRLVVLLMHIPLTSRIPLPTLSIPNRAELYEIIKHRSRVLALSGHTHTHHHMFIEEEAWQGEQPLEHGNLVTVSGAWWRGDPDERGIPHATMRCGGPNGYIIATFDGSDHRWRYKAASRPADYQMDIHAPDEVWSDRAESVPVYANVFGSSERSSVEWRVGGGDWQPMEYALEFDPRYVEIAATQRVPAPLPSNHLWKNALPGDLKPGSRLIEVRTTDVFGQSWQSGRVLRVLDAERRPRVAGIEPAVLLPGGEIRLRVENLHGREFHVLVPTGRNFTPRAIRATRDGDVLHARLPDNLAAGSLRARADLLDSDAVVFELGSRARHGLRGAYYRLESGTRTLPDFSALEPALIRRDATLSFADAASFALPFDAFDMGAVWTGRVIAGQEGEYTFTLGSDDGSRLWINGERLIDNDGVHRHREVSGRVTLEAGEHEIRVEYFNLQGGASLSLKWQPPGSDSAELVPTTALLPPSG